MKSYPYQQGRCEEHGRWEPVEYRTTTARDGRPYYWRISECPGCGMVYTEAQYDPFEEMAV